MKIKPVINDAGNLTIVTEPLKVTGQARNQRFYDLISPIFPWRYRSRSYQCRCNCQWRTNSKRKRFFKKI